MKKFLQSIFIASITVIGLAVLAGFVSDGPIEMPLHIAKIVAGILYGSIAAMIISGIAIGSQTEKN